SARVPQGFPVDRYLLVGADKPCPEGVKAPTRRVHRVGCLAETNAEGKTGFLTGLSGLEERVERPVVRLGRTAGRIHRLHVDSGVLLHEIDARAGPLDLATDCCRNRQPAVLPSPEVGNGTVHGAVLLDQRLHDVVNTLETVRVFVWRPG